jgi:hypothetical protein
MTDISPRMSPRMATIYAMLQANPNAEVDALSAIQLGNADSGDRSALLVTQQTYPDGFLTALYPKLDPGATTLSAGEWMEIIALMYTQLWLRFQQRDIAAFETKFPVIAAASAIGKQQLTGTIGRSSQGSAIVPAMIRPVTVFANGGSAVENWLQTAVAAGWTDPFFTINLNKTGATVNISPQNRVVMLVLGLADVASSPKMFEYQWKNAALQPLGVRSLPFIHTVNNMDVWEFDEAIMIQRAQQMTLGINFEAAGAAIPELLGIQFQTPDYATAE